ncbi:MAG: hypothetical protein WC328_00905 [Kiritimatiellia bacterium]|jgi:hypothetical protein|nr:hypothetical protein [Kiritimatiellia bacterium]MDD4172757.1 hypothetical protein [Kiritimatiellia bacterium]MDD4441594.1 hypothetical protein [Kiritimatiellia bacterium]MDX9791926.1 hypothetical protein [Kiritimatiellia bacterium]
MKRSLIILAAVAVLGSPAARAQSRTQTVSLSKGWNAVWLEVEPDVADPAAVFEGTPIDRVAAYTLPASEAQFATRTEVNVHTLAGWTVWFAPHRADAPLSRLARLSGNKGYLMHASEPVTLAIPGTVRLSAPRWMPDCYNLVGFTVEAPGGPTFRQFFQGSPAHAQSKIYRLVNGTWRQVLAPDSEALRPGEAFWIYCKGASDYPGPLQVTTASKMAVCLSGTTPCRLMFLNRATHPLSFTLEQVTAGNSDVPMSARISVYSDRVVGQAGTASVDFPAGTWTQAFPVYEAGSGVTLPLSLRPGSLAAGTYHSLLKVTTDIGSVTYVPVTAVNE